MKASCQICGKEFDSQREAEMHEYDEHVALPGEPKPTPIAKPPSVPLQPIVGPLGPKHTGMRVSASGLLGRIARGDRLDSGSRFMVSEMLKHLEQMASEYYAGKVTIVDEFLQLYALDDARPNPTLQGRADCGAYPASGCCVSESEKQ